MLHLNVVGAEYIREVSVLEFVAIEALYFAVVRADLGEGYPDCD
jgi:hypothetical protein